MENWQCHKHGVRVDYRVGQPRQPFHYPPLSSSSSSSLLHLELFQRTTHFYYIFPEEGMPLHVKTIRVSDGVDSVTMDRGTFLEDNSYSRALVLSLLRNCGPVQDDVADWVVSKARLTIVSGQGQCDAVRVCLKVDWLHACYESILVREVLQRSFEEANSRMQTASKSALESLKKVDLESDEYESLLCAVCLEELCNKEILRMPCFHMFHGDCILRWLNNSHYCPICRFELPTQ